MGTDDRSRHHFLVFDAPSTTLSAVHALRAEGFDIADVHSPFPIHGIEDACGIPPTRLPWATFIGGAVGLSIGFALQAYVHAYDWPVNIGGKSDLALPAMAPVVFELTVLLAAFFTVGTLFWRSGLIPPLDGELPKSQPIPAVSDDQFVVKVVEHDGSFERDAFERICERLEPLDVIFDRRPA